MIILDCTRLSAVYGPRLLAEAGHRVIRLELRDDDVRSVGPFVHDTHDLEHGAYHLYLNAGKESVIIDDPATPAGKQQLLALARLADCAVVTVPSVMDVDVLLAANARLTLVTVDDVRNELAAYSRSGLLALTGHPGKTPVLLGGHAALSVVGLYVALAALAATMLAEASGKGQRVEVSALQCLQTLVEQPLLTYQSSGTISERRGNRGGYTAVSGCFPCADGWWMCSTGHDGRTWQRLMEMVQDPVLMADATLYDEGARQEKRDWILDRLDSWSRGSTKAELVLRAQEVHRFPASPVATPLDLIEDPQLVARGFLREIDHPILGKLRFPIGAIAREWNTALRPAPRLGEHSTAILKEAGYTQPATPASR